MKYNFLGRTGVLVSELCLGAKKHEQLLDNIASLKLHLSTDEMK